MPGLILTGLSVDGVVLEFEELILYLGLGGGTDIGVLVDVVLEPACLLQFDNAVDLNQLKPLLDGELEVEVICEIVYLVEDTGHDFDIHLCEIRRVVPDTQPTACHSEHWR